MVSAGRVEDTSWRVALCLIIGLMGSATLMDAKPRRILLDTDVNTDDLFALFYLLKQNRSEFDLKAVTVNANAWVNAGHAVNHVYDILYMMDRDDIPVGVGGDGGILPDGTIRPDVGGYLPLLEQGMSTVGDCRYRQAIPIGSGGRLDVDTGNGLRRSILPQGPRKYSPLHQPTVQKVMTDTISEDRTTVFLIGAHTNFAIFLMANPHLKKNIEHIYVMGGGVRSKNPTGCCPKDANPTCTAQQCGDHGNLYTAFGTNPYAEFNIFADPFAAYQVFHWGIPITLVPLDATNTIPVSEQFVNEFERQQGTYEAQYCFRSLKMVRDTWFDDQFYRSYFMWDSLTVGVALSDMRNSNNRNGDNEFAEMEYMNITVATSNEPYGAYDGSNPFFDGRAIPKFNLEKNGVHSGHVQTGVHNPFCSLKGVKKGRCKDGYTMEVTGPEAVQVLVATKAKANKDATSKLDREFFRSFLDVLNIHQQSGRFNFSTEFPYYHEELYKPDFTYRKMGKPIIFDMDMSAGDFISLIYLLKVPVEVVDLKGILVSSNGWANAATIDIIYDILHMMGRDDIPVGLGSVTALGTPTLGCKYVNAIPHGSGGLIDSDTLFGLARDLPRSPRRYTTENSVKHGAPRNTDHPELRQPLALEVWQSISRAMNLTDKITILTNGPLTNLANIILSDKNATSFIEKVYIVGGHVIEDQREEGNIFSVPSNKYAEFNMFLDPLAGKTVIESSLDITLIPLKAQRKVTSFSLVLESLRRSDSTPESMFVYRLLSLLHGLQQKNQLYRHVDIFLGEVIGAVFLHDQFHLNSVVQAKRITILTDNVTTYGQITIDERNGKLVNVLDNLDSEAYYSQFADLLADKVQSAVIGSFDEQKRKWSAPCNETGEENTVKDFSL